MPRRVSRVFDQLLGTMRILSLLHFALFFRLRHSLVCADGSTSLSVGRCLDGPAGLSDTRAVRRGLLFVPRNAPFP